MEYDFEVDARDVYKKVKYRVIIRHSWKVGMRLRLSMLLLELAKRICPSKMTIEETNKF